jgi:nicotinate-nucleotide pyrophosphorylase (carboxylating)
MTTHRVPPLNPILYEDLIRRALLEDLGRGGDLTTDAIVDADAVTGARVFSRAPGRLAGVEVTASVFRLLDPAVEITVMRPDGADLDAADTVAEIAGPARAILSGERTALNILGRLSGIATLTRSFVKAIAATPARVVCTRKTTPGLRVLEKYAVRCGGGANHRFGLDDAVLIKDNHVVAAGGIRPAVERARVGVGHMVMIELEVDTLEQLEEGLRLGVGAFLLRQAVAMVGGRAITEASGGITLDTAPIVAATGVDLLSIGALTHSAPALDVSLEVTG